MTQQTIEALQTKAHELDALLEHVKAAHDHDDEEAYRKAVDKLENALFELRSMIDAHATGSAGDP